MLTSIAANHAKGKAAEDNIFAVARAAAAAVEKFGAEKVVNATIGAIMDEEEKLVCLPTVDKVYRAMPTEELIAYAPIAGTPGYLEKVLDAAFGETKPQAYTGVVATAGGSGVIHHAVWNYMDAGETALTSNWYWAPYQVLCADMGRKLDTYQMLDENNKFNLAALKAKAEEILSNQDKLLLILNTPAHNPIGYSLTEEELKGVIETLNEVTAGKGKNAILLLDIAYIDYAGEREAVRKMFKALDNIPEQVFTIVAYSMSKGFTLYGQRTGAMIGVSSSQEIIDEFNAINQYTSRATWSNINRPAMQTLAKIYSDGELLGAVQDERNHYYEMIKARADLFTKEAEECGLKMLPYVAGFFISIPEDNPEAVCAELQNENVFAVPLKAGIRLAICSVPLKKVYGMAAKIKAAQEKVHK